MSSNIRNHTKQNQPICLKFKEIIHNKLSIKIIRQLRNIYSNENLLKKSLIFGNTERAINPK